MYRSLNTYSVLQAIAATVGLALIFWSFGLPSLRLAEAASVTSYSDTLSDSAPTVLANHTLEYVTNDGVQPGEDIVLTFDASFAGIASIDFGDIDLEVNGVDQAIAANSAVGVWGATTTATSITLSSLDQVIGSTATVTIEIGTNATAGTAGSNQITNPAIGSYEISLASGDTDTGVTEVAIVDTVTVSAAVDTVFTFAVSGVTGGTAVGGTYNTGGDTSTTSIPFGELEAGSATTAAQLLSVSTNAANGFNVTVQVDQQLSSASLGADIDGFANGAFTSTPTAWTQPTAVVGSEETYGHWGISSDDGTNMPLNFSNGADFVSASTTPVTVFSHDGAANGEIQGQGTTTVIYRAEVSSLQEAGTDYTAAVTYVATPVF